MKEGLLILHIPSSEEMEKKQSLVRAFGLEDDTEKISTDTLTTATTTTTRLNHLCQLYPSFRRPISSERVGVDEKDDDDDDDDDD